MVLVSVNSIKKGAPPLENATLAQTEKKVRRGQDFFFITEIYHRAEIYHRNVHNGALLRALEARDANGARRACTASKLCLRDSVIS